MDDNATVAQDAATVAASNLTAQEAVANPAISTVFVGGLAWATDEASLRAHFEAAGLQIAADEDYTNERGESKTRRAVTVARDRFDGRAKGYGFVNLVSPDEAQKAISLLHETELDGRTIRVQLKESKPREGSERTYTPRRNNFNRGGNFNRGDRSFGGDDRRSNRDF